MRRVTSWWAPLREAQHVMWVRRDLPPIAPGKGHVQIQERKRRRMSSLFVLVQLCESSRGDSFNQPLIQFLRVLCADWGRGHSIPREAVDVPFVIKVAEIVEVHGKLIVSTRGGKAIAAKIDRSCNGSLVEEIVSI